MPTSRTIEEKSLGKHLGHACEGHLRGILKRWAAPRGSEVLRALPFDFHVNPDAVVVDERSKVSLIVIVAYWNNADNSHMKFYRTRSEYVAANRAMAEAPNHFDSKAKVITVIYGAPGGWKDKILADLRSTCSPCLYLPDAFGSKPSEALVEEAFSVYAEHWRSGKAASREYTEKFFSEQARLSVHSKALLALLEMEIDKKDAVPGKTAATRSARVEVRLPAHPIRTRYRQALGLLSMFKDEEIRAWGERNVRNPLDGLAKDFAIRAAFLDLADVHKVKSLSGSRIDVRLRRPVRVVGQSEQYAPDLLDFESWEDIPVDKLLNTLRAHRERTRQPGSVFKGGAFDQIAGNWPDVAKLVAREIPPLLSAIARRDRAGLARALQAAASVRPEVWHPAHDAACAFPVWALAACTVAISKQDRAVRSSFDARRQAAPTADDARALATALLDVDGAAEVLGEVAPFLAALATSDIDRIASAQRPRLFSLAEPCSWTADFYNTLTTNSSHNPLAGSILGWLDQRFPGHEWNGWPQRRSISLSEAIGSSVGRRQWQFIGSSKAKGQPFIAVEVKSITANNWGNKSKELYDRVAESRAAAKSQGISIRCIGVLDGDVGLEEFAELATGIGYDEVYSIKEVLGLDQA